MLLHTTLFQLLAHLRGHPVLQDKLTDENFQLFVALIKRLGPTFLSSDHAPPLDLPLDIAQTLISALDWSWDELGAVWQMSRDVIKDIIAGPAQADVNALLAQHGVDHGVGACRSQLPSARPLTNFPLLRNGACGTASSSLHNS